LANQPLPRFYARRQEAERQAKIAKIVLESGGQAPKRIAGATPVGAHRDLRGLPAVAKGVAGVQPGSDPLGALLLKESRAERRAR
jgi:hypothetical protein